MRQSTGRFYGFGQLLTPDLQDSVIGQDARDEMTFIARMRPDPALTPDDPLSTGAEAGAGGGKFATQARLLP